jgi:hypothetical protein
MPLGAVMSTWVDYVVRLFASLYASVVLCSSFAFVPLFGVIRAEGGVSDIFVRGERSRLVDIVMVLPSPCVSTVLLVHAVWLIVSFRWRTSHP